MATYFVASGGSNTSPYDTWAKAATSLQTALTAASSAGDTVVIQYDAVPSGDKEASSSTTYTFQNYIRLISASNDGGSSYTPTVMGTSNWIGGSNAVNGYLLAFAGPGSPYPGVLIWGVTWRTGGISNGQFAFGGSAYVGICARFINCYLWQSSTSTSWNLVCSNSVFSDCTFRFGSTSQSLNLRAPCIFENCSIDAAGSIPATLFTFAVQPSGPYYAVGCDFSSVTGTLVSNSQFNNTIIFDRCKLGSGVSFYFTQVTCGHEVGPKAILRDCSSGDTHGLYAFSNPLGSLSIDSGIYFTSGAAGKSWKIVTTSAACRAQPFVTQWIDLYWDGTSAITPYIEILRDGSSTAFTDAEVWIEIAAKTTSGYTTATFSNDRQTINSYLAGTTGSDQADGAGLGSWTGEGGTAKSMKLQLGSSITPAEIGSLTARIYVAKASTTLYVDPQIRT